MITNFKLFEKKMNTTLIKKGDFIMSDIDIRDGFKKNGNIIIKKNKLYKVLEDQHEFFQQLLKVQAEDYTEHYLNIDDHITFIPKKDAELYFDSEKYNI